MSHPGTKYGIFGRLLVLELDFGDDVGSVRSKCVHDTPHLASSMDEKPHAQDPCQKFDRRQEKILQASLCSWNHVQCPN